MGLGASALAQAETRLQVSSARQTDDSGKSQLVYTARVADVSGSTVSGGTVSFETSKGSLGSAVVTDGEASLKVDSLPAKVNSVTAVYHDATGAAVSSEAISATPDDDSTTPDFTVTASPSSLSTSPGDYVSSTITITPENGFSELVTLSCSGNPATTTCTFSPTTVTPTNGNAVTSTLQIQTTSASGNLSRLAAPADGKRVAWALAGPGILALAGLGALRRRNAGVFRMMGVLALLVAGSFGMSACSTRYAYLNKGPSPTGGTAAGTYTIAIAAYGNNGSSVTSHTIDITLTVK
ncbi:hypothetical protein GCM10011586_14210 [Silvibacterium dinghuense]|nr:hypothetical protein GCM10011586_14210 [Silvibacterium dinghuense]